MLSIDTEVKYYERLFIFMSLCKKWSSIRDNGIKVTQYFIVMQSLYVSFYIKRFD